MKEDQTNNGIYTENMPLEASVSYDCDKNNADREKRKNSVFTNQLHFGVRCPL